ncbi:hypothetical protein V499_01067 [Pseudogymnoascus sp. VKM F-103]|nr:hypothetical protein V499_01067 [Pseudogymnoascus sp. VKM F-103]
MGQGAEARTFQPSYPSLQDLANKACAVSFTPGDFCEPICMAALAAASSKLWLEQYAPEEDDKVAFLSTGTYRQWESPPVRIPSTDNFATQGPEL